MSLDCVCKKGKKKKKKLSISKVTLGGKTPGFWK